MAGARDAGNLETFLGELQSGHPVKSYWAAIGLLLLCEEAREAAPAMEQALDQVAPWTGIALAEALIGAERIRGIVTELKVLVRERSGQRPTHRRLAARPRADQKDRHRQHPHPNGYTPARFSRSNSSPRADGSLLSR